MKFKLDENFGSRTQELFVKYGHDAETVLSQKLQGSTDELLYKICCSEQRCLVTLDKDFSDIIRFSPERSGGIVIVRSSINPSVPLLNKLIISFLEELKNNSVVKKLWVIEPGRIRIHQAEKGDN